MTTDQIAGTLLISGATIFLVGAAVGVPRVFSERDPKARLQMLEEHRRLWRLAQPFYALGPLIASLGVGYLAGNATAGWLRSVFLVASLALLVGSLTWAWSVYLRANRIPEFAFGTLPAWPFTSYVLLTIGGLGFLSIGLLAGHFPIWLGWLTLTADLLFLLIYLRFRDIPPFVFYLLLTLVGFVVL